MRWIIGIFVVVMAAVGIAVYLSAPAPQDETVPTVAGVSLPKLAYQSPPVPVAPALRSPRIPPVGFAEYRSAFYKFQFFYPKDFKIVEYVEQGSGRTMVFKSGGVDVFQVFVTPYGAAEISPERFASDIPSGVIESPTDIAVDGAKGVSFFSKDPMLGDTFEVWFVARGFLYEVTTHRQLSQDLLVLLQSWQLL